MKYILAIFLFFLGYRIYKWYGYDKGKANPSHWRPIHSNELVNILVNLICIGFYVCGVLVLINL